MAEREKEAERERLLEKMRREDERMRKLKADKEDREKFMRELGKEITLKKHELDDKVHKAAKKL